MLDLNKHIVKSDDDQSFHTSGYATANNGQRIGAVSTQSFEKRIQMEKNRQRVGSYRQSAMGNSYSAVRPKTVEPGQLTTRSAIANARSEAPAPPPKYNPFA